MCGDSQNKTRQVTVCEIYKPTSTFTTLCQFYWKIMIKTIQEDEHTATCILRLDNSYHCQADIFLRWRREWIECIHSTVKVCTGINVDKASCSVNGTCQHKWVHKMNYTSSHLTAPPILVLEAVHNIARGFGRVTTLYDFSSLDVPIYKTANK